MKDYTRFLLSMGKIGCIGFGGGSALIPLIEDEVVQKRKMDTRKNLDEDVIVASITPGALPVEIASAIGKRNFGTRGMVMGAFAMAFPGAFVTVLLLTILSGVRQEVLPVIEILSVAVSVFIIYLLISYIVNMLRECRKESRAREYKALGLMAAVFLMVCEGNIYQIVGVDVAPILGVSTLHVLILAFFCIFYSQGRYSGKNLTIMTATGAIYLLGHGKAHMISNPYLLYGTEAIMLFLACWGLWQNIQRSEWKFQGNGKQILKDIKVWALLLVIFSIPALVIHREALVFMGRGVLSALMSFGGGDAYLTIADGLFVESNMISSEQYYGQIVVVVNMLPGSILCKTLSGVGYYIGMNLSGRVLGGILFAMVGFSCSIAASCGFFVTVHHLYDNLLSLRVFQMISRWIRPIIAGLLINVMLSLCSQSIAILQSLL